MWKPYVKGGTHGDNDSLSFIRISLLEAFLSREGMQAHAPSVSWGGILQPFRCAGTWDCHPIDSVHQEGSLGQVYRYQLCGQHPSAVCKNQRIHMHKTFKDIAQRGKCSMGWFLGFKLHLICNEKGELLNFMITPSDVDDRKHLEEGVLLEHLCITPKHSVGKSAIYPSLYRLFRGKYLTLCAKICMEYWHNYETTDRL